MSMPRVYSGKPATLHGRPVDYGAAVNLMDDKLREELNSSRNWLTEADPEQAFLDAYAQAHAERFGKPFDLG